MKVLLVVTVTLLVALGQTAQNICAPPQFTSIGQMAVTQMTYSLVDYEKGVIFLTNKDDKFGDRWLMLNFNDERIYIKETGETCFYYEMKPGFTESYGQCLPEDAKEIDNVFGWKMFLTVREDFSSIMVLKPVTNSPYYVWSILSYGIKDEIVELFVAYEVHLGINETSLLDTDVSGCVLQA